MRHTGYRRFIYWFFGFVAMLLVALAGFNYLIDPYGVWSSPRVRGLNATKPLGDSKNGLRVSWDIRRLKPEALIFGTSTSKHLDPVAYGALVGEPASYNAGVILGSLGEARSLLDLALREQPEVDHVLLALDFLQFNDRGAAVKKLLEPSTGTSDLAQESASLLLSAPGLSASTTTLMKNVNAAKTGGSPISRRIVFGRYFGTVKDAYAPYSLSERALDDLKAIVDTCKERGIDLRVVVTPMHARHMDVLYTAGLGDDYQQWLRRVAAITPYWDFSGYNSITTEPVADVMRSYLDPLHYSGTIGTLMMQRVYAGSQAATDFGVLVTPANIEQHLIALEAQRAKTWPSLDGSRVIGWDGKAVTLGAAPLSPGPTQ